MSVLKIFGYFFGWCPKFNGVPEQFRAGEENYSGSTALFIASLLTGLSMIAIYAAFIVRARAGGFLVDNGVRTVFSFLITGGILFLNFSGILWKIGGVTISMLDWSDVKRVYLTSFVIMTATSLVVWLYLPKALIDWNYPIVYFSYIVTNHVYARRVIRKDLQ